MVLGLRYGGTSPDRDAKEAAYARIREFAARFKARNGSLAVQGLVGVRHQHARRARHAKERNLFATACPKFVRDAAAILEEML